ncbi:hypothetical protein WJX73_000983 [Symbiochloris irregularis]|uniref:C3H1-type domain-containing protein n=1 Tax=Symbiochloris irregularis TaxID=706552 RepID=A0AAW1P2X1_9CHLO
MDDDDLNFDFEDNLAEQQAAHDRMRQEAQQAHQHELMTHHNHLPQATGQGFQPRRHFRQTVCTYWLKGLCMKGNECGFLHEFDPTKMPICRTLLRYGECKEPDCPYKHTLDDVKECNMYRLGFCVYGPTCRYKHTRLPGPAPDPSTVDAAKPREQRSSFHNYQPRTYDIANRPRPAMPYLGGGDRPDLARPENNPPSANDHVNQNGDQASTSQAHMRDSSGDMMSQQPHHMMNHMGGPGNMPRGTFPMMPGGPGLAFPPPGAMFPMHIMPPGGGMNGMNGRMMMGPHGIMPGPHPMMMRPNMGGRGMMRGGMGGRGPMRPPGRGYGY